MIIGTWTYDAKDSFDDFIEPFVDKGFDVFITPGVLNSRRVMPDWGQTITNIHNFVRDGAEHDVMGMVNTVWDDGGFAFFSIDWYGVAYSADQSWNPQEMDLPWFNQRFNQAVNIDPTDYFTESLLRLKEIGDFIPTNGMNQKIVWMKLIPEKNKSLNLSTDEWDRVLEVCDQAQDLLWQASPQLNGDELSYFDFIIELYRFLAQIRYNLLDASEHYEESINIQKENPVDTRSNLIYILDLVDETITLQENIITQYRNLWLNENHTYSLDIILNRFREVVGDLREMQNLVFESLTMFDSGKPILSKSEVSLDIN